MWDSSLESLKDLFKDTSKNKKKRVVKKLIADSWAHYRRATATMTIREGMTFQKEVISARVFLNEIYPKGLQLFSEKRLQEWQPLSLFIEFPIHFFVQGRVISCSEINLSWGILTQQKFPYRTTIEFLFTTPFEKNVVLQYYRKVQCLMMGQPPEASIQTINQ